MQSDEANFLGHMPTERMLKIRTKIVKCILATDNAQLSNECNTLQIGNSNLSNAVNVYAAQN